MTPQRWIFSSVSLGQNLPPQKKTYTAPTLGEDLVLSHSGLNKKLPAESQAIDKHRIFRSLRKEITSQSADVKRRYTFFGAWFQHAMSQPTLQHVEKAGEQVLQNPYFQPRIRWLKLTGQVFEAPFFRFPLFRHSEFFFGAAWNYPCSCPPAGPLKSYGLSSLVKNSCMACGFRPMGSQLRMT